MTNDVNLIRRRMVAGIALGGATYAIPEIAAAQTFPSQHITLVLPYAVGGTTDVLARAIQQPLSELLGQPVVIDPKPGASGMVGTRYVARMPADGHTLLLQTNGFLIAPQISKAPGFAPQDLEPVILIAAQPAILVTHPSLPVRSVKELIEYAKANPSKINFGSSGASSVGRLATEEFMRQANIKMTHIPYKGVADITQALVRGDVQLFLSITSPQMNEFIKDGRLNLIGVASLEPSPLVPGAEPIARTLDGFAVEIWIGLLAPKNTPRAVIDKINHAVAATLAQPRVKAVFASTGAGIVSATPDEFKSRMEHEYKAWATVLSTVKITEE